MACSEKKLVIGNWCIGYWCSVIPDLIRDLDADCLIDAKIPAFAGMTEWTVRHPGLDPGS